METPIILFLTSTSLHFPLDLQEVLVNEGHEAKRIDSIDDFLSSPDRHRPYLAVLEVGSTDDLDRAQLAYEWCEIVQPIAECRVLLLIASKNIVLGERAARFGGAEIAHLPLPLKNLLFKIDLQKRLLFSDQGNTARAKRHSAGFSASFEERPPNMERVLLVRGPGPKSGHWQEAADSPQGKIRWRWVATPKSEAEQELESLGIAWVAESRSKPVFEESNQAWAIEDPAAELLGFKKNKQVYSAQAAFTAQEKLKAQSQDPAATGKAIAEEKASATKEQLVSEQAEGNPDSSVPAANIPGRALRDPSPEESAPAQRNEELPDPAKPRPDRLKPSSSAEKPRPATPLRASVPPPEMKIGKLTPDPERQWNVHTPEKTRDFSAAAKKGPSPAMPEEKILTGAEARSQETRPTEEPAPAKEEIPQFHSQDEEDSSTGYSISVPSSGINAATENVATPSEEFFPNPQEESSMVPTDPGIDKNKVKQEESPGAATSAQQGGGRFASGNDPEAAKKARARTEGQAPERAKQPTPEKELGPKMQPANLLPEKPSGSRPEKQPASPVHRLEKKASPSEEILRSASSGTNEETSAAAGQSAHSPAPEDDTRIHNEKRMEPVSTRITVEGETSRSGEEIRIRALVEQERNAARAKKSAEVEDFLKYRHFVTMSLEELNDRDSSWHPADKYRVYISAHHRYYRVKDPKAFLPLWVYEGELAPEFLEEKRAWKFYDRYPEIYATLDTLPPVVLESIYRAAGILPPAEGTGTPAPAAPAAIPVIAPEPPKSETPEESSWGVLRFLKKIFKF
ncbi:MAG: hypothetical protein AB7K68_13980 [Bacteriovoracia bacterium]